jgi:hypothetical protein
VVEEQRLLTAAQVEVGLQSPVYQLHTIQSNPMKFV